MKLTIYEDRWLRGNAGSSFLENHDWHMCCMGFLARACGIDRINGVRYFRALDESEHQKLPEVLRPIKIRDIIDESDLATRIYEANDENRYYTEEQRKEKLIELFKEADIDVDFQPVSPR